MVQLKIVLNTRQKKADGTYSIYYTITESRKVYYVYSGYSVVQEHWNEANRTVKKANLNAQVINASISKRYFEIQKIIVQLEDEKQFSISRLKERLNPKKVITTVKEFADMLIEQMFSQNQTGNAIIYRTAINKLFAFHPNTALRFIDIDLRFLENYHAFLIEEKISVNGISNYLRTLRAIYNKAIREKVIEKNYYPFGDFKIKQEKTIKRAVNSDVIKRIKSSGFEYSSIQNARDMFLLSFYLIGISFTDLAYLKRADIQGNRLMYRRKKTGKLYNVLINNEALTIINKYSHSTQKYLLPVLGNDVIEGSLQAKCLIHQWIKTTNKYLNKVVEELKIEYKLTTYVSRHSWATIAKRLGYSNEVIAEAMGHEYGNSTTNIYLDAFDKGVIDEMSKRVSSLS
ncbi:MAG: phage integrase SAM-like domain-containing protein [Sphingobacteriaceae bacterium]|nr:phage integrase SAM-like domain-containing protein [Sphingobacteriaceae bacterium]